MAEPGAAADRPATLALDFIALRYPAAAELGRSAQQAARRFAPGRKSQIMFDKRPLPG